MKKVKYFRIDEVIYAAINSAAIWPAFQDRVIKLYDLLGEKEYNSLTKEDQVRLRKAYADYIVNRYSEFMTKEFFELSLDFISESMKTSRPIPEFIAKRQLFEIIKCIYRGYKCHKAWIRRLTSGYSGVKFKKRYRFEKLSIT